MKSKIFFLLWLATATTLYAQQDPMYNQYIFNAYTINAAEAGTRNYGTASMLYRWQWVGIDGSPATGSIGVETGVGKGWGFGLNMVDDRIGPAQNQTINLSVAYHLNLTEQVKMSVGVNLVSNIQRVLLSRLQNLTDLNDPKLAANVNNFNPNAGGGILIYTPKSFFGAAMPRFNEYKLTNNDLISLDQLRHYFIYGGHIFKAGPHIKLKPSVMAKVVEGAPVEFDLNGVISLYEVIDLGANYRIGDGVGLLLGLNIMERLILNYAYEIPLTRLRYGSIQTHEVGVRYRFGKAHFERIQSPRFFN